MSQELERVLEMFLRLPEERRQEMLELLQKESTDENIIDAMICSANRIHTIDR